ncbi:HGxxPAAW family protein [Streptomyces sp. NPDC059866]|uniref:HGxxPAAW family protein n=1 Tax=Streptomyces sp. NPDC059866 TaxID=3346978 RepID=UPI003666BE64
MSAHGDVDMGHTVAGWTGTAIGVLGSAVVGVGLCLDSAVTMAGGAGIAVLAVLTTWVLHLTGWGKPSGPRPRAEWDWRVKDTMTRHGDCVGCALAGRRRAARRPAAAPRATDSRDEPAVAET